LVGNIEENSEDARREPEEVEVLHPRQAEKREDGDWSDDEPAAEISGDQDGASSMSIDPHADEEAEEKERKGPERSEEAHLSRGCQ